MRWGFFPGNFELLLCTCASLSHISLSNSNLSCAPANRLLPQAGCFSYLLPYHLSQVLMALVSMWRRQVGCFSTV